MADGDDERIRKKKIERHIRRLLDSLDEKKISAENRLRPGIEFMSEAEVDVHSSALRILQLWRDTQIFQFVLRRLREQRRKTIPGVYFENGSLPSNPSSPELMLSNDPIAERLRSAWTQGSGIVDTRRLTDGSVIHMPFSEAKDAFSAGMASAIFSSGNLVHFTVNSRNKKYRVHVTERYWYSPVVFGTRLSTPVDDMIYPADYRFGGDLNGGPILWDSGIHTASSSRTSTTVTKF